jgi:hypothetical protein
MANLLLNVHPNLINLNFIFFIIIKDLFNLILYFNIHGDTTELDKKSNIINSSSIYEED